MLPDRVRRERPLRRLQCIGRPDHRGLRLLPGGVRAGLPVRSRLRGATTRGPWASARGPLFAGRGGAGNTRRWCRGIRGSGCMPGALGGEVMKAAFVLAVLAVTGAASAQPLVRVRLDTARPEAPASSLEGEGVDRPGGAAPATAIDAM